HLPWPSKPSPHLLVLLRQPRVAPPGQRPYRTARSGGPAMSTFTATLQSFFTTYLISQKAASPHTIAAYRDTFKMLLTHLHDTTGLTPDAVEFTDVNAEAITEFLRYLET